MWREWEEEDEKLKRGNISKFLLVVLIERKSQIFFCGIVVSDSLEKIRTILHHRAAEALSWMNASKLH